MIERERGETEGRSDREGEGGRQRGEVIERERGETEGRSDREGEGER